MSSAFDRWIRNNAPGTHDDADSARLLWTRIEDRMHQRRQRRITRGSGLIAATVIIVVVGFVDVNPLGSYNWSLIPASDPDMTFEDPFTGRQFKAQTTTTAGLPAKEFWEKVHEQQAAGIPSLDGIDFYELDARFQWMLFYRHQIGEHSRAATGDIDRPNTISVDVSQWLLPHAMSQEEDFAAGRWRAVPSRRYPVNGREFWFEVWVKSTDRGLLYYGSAVIPEDLK